MAIRKGSVYGNYSGPPGSLPRVVRRLQAGSNIREIGFVGQNGPVVNPQPKTESEILGFPRPLYVIVCPVTADLADSNQPIMYNTPPSVDDLSTSFDAELAPILPAIWYALHLPKTRFEVLDLPVLGIRDSLKERRRHQIWLIPSGLLERNELLAAVTSDGEPMLMLCTDQDLEAAKIASAAAGFALPPVSVTELTQDGLDAHWKAMNDRWISEWPEWVVADPISPEWASKISLQGSVLSRRRLLRSLGKSEVTGADDADERCESAFDVLRIRAWIEAVASLEEREIGFEAAELQIPATVAAAARRLRLPLTISLSGVAPRYRRHMRELALASSENDLHAGPPSALDDPPEVLGLMVAHNASGDDSMGVMFEDHVPDAAFVALADLERHWVSGVQSRKDERLRVRLDATMNSFWTEPLIQALRSTSQIDAFTNFPIGLLRMPGDSAPLAAQYPIAYRPINPLTRALQFEFMPDRIVDLSGGMRVLILECIPSEDPVGEASRQAWSYAAGRLTDKSRNVFIESVSVSNRTEFTAAVIDHRPDVLVISAHGSYAPESNLAGLMIGTDLSFGVDLGPMPPMVILSACHTGPRGAGPVSVADLLLRAGARAVLSTLVPVDVRHNSVFMTRFLLYMCEVIAGAERHVSVLDLWHRVQTSSVITDVVHGNPKLFTWATSKIGDSSPMEEFMMNKSRGRVRTQHLYADTEDVLLEIAAERGMEDSVRAWLRSPGYAPESMMYTFVGDPSCIRLQPPELVRQEFPSR